MSHQHTNLTGMRRIHWMSAVAALAFSGSACADAPLRAIEGMNGALQQLLPLDDGSVVVVTSDQALRAVPAKAHGGKWTSTTVTPPAKNHVHRGMEPGRLLVAAAFQHEEQGALGLAHRPARPVRRTGDFCTGLWRHRQATDADTGR